MCVNGFAEGLQDDGAGNAAVRGDRDRVAGASVAPAGICCDCGGPCLTYKGSERTPATVEPQWNATIRTPGESGGCSTRLSCGRGSSRRPGYPTVGAAGQIRESRGERPCSLG
jgi:hypothetical protein